MPLNPNALRLIRANLEALQRNERPPAVTIGHLTPEQTRDINAQRAQAIQPLPPISGEIYFVGRHIYERRIMHQRYTVEDVLDQVASALSSGSKFIHTRKSTLLQNHKGRSDRYGNTNIQDQAVLECTARNPKAQLYSVIPKGDGKGGD